MKNFLVFALFIFSIHRLNAQHIDVNYEDTSKAYIAPVIYYDDTLVPSVITNEIMSHIVSLSTSRVVYPQIAPLIDFFRKGWVIDADCFDTKIIVPDFNSPYIAFYWDNRTKCFRGLSAVLKK